MPATRTFAVTPDKFTTFGELLRFLRRRAGLTQHDFSLAVGYSASQISRLEQNGRPPDVASLAARFVPALQLENEPGWANRLLELAAVSRAMARSPESVSFPAAQAPPHNLPNQLTSFIGRETVMAQARQMLGEARLVTLTGPGGSGKTRLSLEIATQMLADFPAGVWLVELAPLTDPALLPQVIASVLGVPEQLSRPILDTLKSYLRGRTALLVLDNCEHMVAACAFVAEALLAACPQLHLLATSREILDLAGEATLSVPPLSSPDERQPAELDALARYEAVQLFVDRATTALPGFALTPANALAVSQVCRQLDGMPLAIEMAAARVKLLHVDQISARLNDRFRLLTGGRRTALPRHQSLAAVIAWSYELLPESEQALFQRLAVFAGGWTLDAAESVCADETEGIGSNPVLDRLTGLVNKSLVVPVQRVGQETRYHYLETIRQYAQLKLAASGEEAATRRRHARYYRTLAETAEPHLTTPDMRHWLDRVSADLDNFRAAVAWSHATADQAEEGLRLASALWQFWARRESKLEGRAWFEGGLRLADAVSEPVRAQAFQSAGWLAEAVGDFSTAASHFETGLRISQAIGDPLGQAWALCGLGRVAWHGRDDDRAQALLDESMAIFRRSADELGVAQTLVFLGVVARARGDLEAAQAHYAVSLRLCQQLGYLAAVAAVTMQLGHLARARGNDLEAGAYYADAALLFRELGDDECISEILISQARLAHNQGDDERAWALLVESVLIVRRYDNKVMGAFCLAGFGGVAATQHQPQVGVRLLSAAAAAFAAVGHRLTVGVQAEYDRDVAAAHEQLDEATFAAAWAAGHAMPLDQAIDLALGL